MALTKQDVLHVAKLANLTLTPKEVEIFAQQLSSVVESFDELSQVDTTDTIPTSQVTGLIDVWREDVLQPVSTLTQDEALSGTEKTHNGHFVVDYVFADAD